MPSRKNLILHNYTTLEKALQKYISKDIFPNLEDNDITDVVYFITMSFEIYFCNSFSSVV